MNFEIQPQTQFNQTAKSNFISLFILLALFWFTSTQNRTTAATVTVDKNQPDISIDGFNLEELSLEELMNVTITSVSKKPQQLYQAAAAVFVITQEDIKRSGVRTLPDVFRMVPGLSVAKLDANKWVVSARGFSDRLSSKLLVLLDGRTMYSPLFSGVFWEAHDLLLDDIERIEVIRGPGATLYGANAVNGVINIITKNAKDTQGASVSAGTGSEEHGFGYMRYGGIIGDDTFYRAYAKFADRDSQPLRDGTQSTDDWQSFRSGFRFDTDATEKDQITTIGNVYLTDAGSPYRKSFVVPPFIEYVPYTEHLFGADILTRWNHTVSDTEDFSLQLYYDRTVRDSFSFKNDIDIVNIDFQHHFQPISRHDLIWGLGYRYIGDTLDDSIQIMFNPLEREDHIFNAFIQDEIELIDDELTFIIGTKIEHNEYTGLEVQPNARLIWTPWEEHVFWSSVSHAVRTPSRGEQDSTILVSSIPPDDFRNPLPIPSILSLVGNRNVQSEELVAYELGYRFIPATWFSLDLALFYHDYQNLLSAAATDATVKFLDGVPYFDLPLLLNNEMRGETYGAELAMDIQISSKWKVRSSYTLFDIKLHPTQPSFLQLLEEYEHRNSHFQFSVLSMFDITDQIQLDIWARYTSELADTFQIPRFDFERPAYLGLDVRLAWKPKENLEMVFGVQNIVDDQHPELGESPISVRISEVERSFYFMTTWSF